MKNITDNLRSNIFHYDSLHTSFMNGRENFQEKVYRCMLKNSRQGTPASGKLQVPWAMINAEEDNIRQHCIYG